MREESYFVSEVLGGVKDVFLSCCSQVLSYLNLECKSVFEIYKSPVQEKEFYGELFGVIDLIPTTFVGEIISY